MKMKTEAELKFPTLFLEKSLDAPYLERFSFPKIECEVLDEERVRTIVGVLETVSLWGGEELALLKDVAAKVDLLTGVCNSLQRCMTDAAHSTTKIIPVETLNESLGLSRPIF